jgi:hypothetical protein
MRKTIVDLLAQADATINDNTSQDITAADVRNMVRDIIDTFCPGFGAVGNPSVTLNTLGTLPVVIPYSEMLAVTTDFVANLSAGTVQRKAMGLPSTNTRVTFYSDIAAADGSEIVMSLYRDGVNVPGGTTASGRGIGNVVEASFEIINAQPIAGDPVYSVRASKITGAADNVTFSNVRLILEVVPTIGV